MRVLLLRLALSLSLRTPRTDPHRRKRRPSPTPPDAAPPPRVPSVPVAARRALPGDRPRARAVLHGLEDLRDVGPGVGRDAGGVGVSCRGVDRGWGVGDEGEEGALGCGAGRETVSVS